MVRNAVRHPVEPWRAGHFVGGHPVLDLVNTVAHRVDPLLAEDRLRDGEALCTWALSAGLLTQAQAGPPAYGASQPDTVAAVRGVREAAWAALSAVARQASPPDQALRHLTAVASESCAGLRIAPAPGGLEVTPKDPRGAIRALPGLLAWRALEAILVLPPVRLRACPRCGWLFHDTTRGGRRKWCSMRTCGNREKARRHYRSARPDTGRGQGKG